MNYKIYPGAKVIETKIGDNSIIGQDTYVEKSTLSDNVQINRRNILSNVLIGSYTYTGANTVIKRANIGKFCSISWNVSITGNKHDYNNLTSHPFTCLSSFGLVPANGKTDYSTVNIGNDVWIGMNVSILPGITIGNGAVIGAGSVVTKDVPPFAIVVGNPAKILKFRFSDDIVSEIQKSEWWNLDVEVIRNNIDKFSNYPDLEWLKKTSKNK